MAVSHQGGLSSGSTLNLIKVVSRQGGLPSGWSFIRVVSHQGGLPSGWSFIRVVSHHGGLNLITVVFYHGSLSSEWYLVREDSHQGGLSSEWTLIMAVSHQVVLSSGWSFIRSFIILHCFVLLCLFVLPQSFCAALHQELTEYYRLIAVLEAQVTTAPGFSRSDGTTCILSAKSE